MVGTRRIPRAIVLIAVFSTALESVTAQSLVPAIKATSKTITIIDGDDELTGEITPELDPDVYVYHPTAITKTVSIVTDVDRLDVTVEPGQSYDFIILYEGKRCKQRLSAVHPAGVIYRSKTPGGITDSIPFTLGPNNAIHIKGSINSSTQLDLIFDTGASVGVLSDEGKTKHVAIVDGFKNQIQLESMTIDNSAMVYIDYGGKLRADGVVGYNAFIGKIVHVDYEKGLLSVSDRLPELGAGYAKVNLAWRGAGTFVPISLGHGNTSEETLVLLDTGSKWSLSLTRNERFSRDNYSKVVGSGWRTGVMANGNRVLNKVFDLDRLTVGSHTLNHVQAEIEEPSQVAGLEFSILGNDFLKRFNVAIDYRESAAYFQPNEMAKSPYNSVFNPKTAVLVGGLLLSIVLAGGIYWRSHLYRGLRCLVGRTKCWTRGGGPSVS